MHWFSHLLIETERKLHIVDIVVYFTFNSNIYCLKPHYKNISTTHYHYLVEFSTSLMTSQHPYPIHDMPVKFAYCSSLCQTYFLKKCILFCGFAWQDTYLWKAYEFWIFLTIPNETNIITTHCGDNFTFTRSIVLN